MSSTIDYQGCLSAFNETVSQATAHSTSLFLEQGALVSRPTRHESLPSAANPTFLESLRQFFADNIKPLFDKGKADAELERELGLAYGALITHLLAIYASWTQYYHSNNMQIDLQREAKEHSLRAATSGRACVESTTNTVLRLMREETLFMTNAQTFINMANNYLKGTPYPNYCSLGRSTRSEVEITCLQFNGSDPCSAPLGVVFDNDYKQQLLRNFAEIAFDKPVEFDSAFSKLSIGK